jgi:hypothetical protein
MVRLTTYCEACAAYGGGGTSPIALTNVADFTDKVKRRARDYG